MAEVKAVPYAAWLSLVEAVKKKGQACDEFLELQGCYPQSTGSLYEQMIHNELAQLENLLLKNAIKKYQKSINMSLEEADLEIAEFAIRNLKKSIRGCLFFTRINEYPEGVRKDLAIQTQERLLIFQAEFGEFLKRLAQDSNSYFAQDLIYLWKKWIPAKIILECKENA